jgi:outer membrane protein assembly factor BamA
MRTNIGKYRLIPLLLVGLFLSQGCRVTRHLDPGQLLLKSEPRFRGNEALSSAQLYAAVESRANSRMIIPKTALAIHNYGRGLEKTFRRKLPPIGPEDEVRGFMARSIRWLKYGIGEPPALADRELLERDLINLRNLYFSYGFFSPRIRYEVDTVGGIFRKKKAKLTFFIEEGEGFRLRRIVLDALDTASVHTPALLAAYGSEACLLKPGERYRHDLFYQERVRAAAQLRNSGFYGYSQESIRFSIDSARPDEAPPFLRYRNSRWLDVRITLGESPPQRSIGRVEVYVRPPGKALADTLAGQLALFRSDSLPLSAFAELGIPARRFDSTARITFHVDSSLLRQLNFDFLSRRIHLKEGYLYQQRDAALTYQRLQELGLFQFALINFGAEAGQLRLNPVISLNLAPRYQVKTGFETFSQDIISTNLPGVGANLSLRDRNAFRRGELLELFALGNVGLYASQEGGSQFQSVYYEAALNASLQVHNFLFGRFFSFLLPAHIRRDISRYSPFTVIRYSIRSERREEFQRFSTGINWSYRWNHVPFSDRALSQFTPLAIEFIDVPESRISPDFAARLEALPEPIRRDYRERFSSRVQYTYTWQNYRSTRARPTYWWRFSGELGGNLPFLADALKIGGGDSSTTDNLLRGRFFYGQYLKASVEGRLFAPMTRNSEWVLRGALGLATPYNQTPLLPQESRFFVGGTNGMRGWQSNTLGPGSSSLSQFQGSSTGTISSLIAPGGELMLELNAEFRLDLGGYFEVAAFTDLGNVWVGQGGSEALGVPEAAFRLRGLRLGWDAGLGLRLDFSFLILRIDLGQQLFAPDLPQGWVFRRVAANPLQLAGRTRLNLGIGYPF